MVIKLFVLADLLACLFESSVISYGDKTSYLYMHCGNVFESSVISYGDKTRTL